jgi:hypothetical protein
MKQRILGQKKESRRTFIAVPDGTQWGSPHAVRLRLEGIGIERGGVVLDVQGVDPVQIVQHRRRPETYRIPILYISVDLP